MNRTVANVQHSSSQQQSQGNVHVVNHDFGGSAELTTTLAHAIADVTGIDVTDTEFTLTDHVDPEALDQLFRPKPDGTHRMNGHVSFSIWGYQVTVHSTGQITIVPPQQVSTTPPQ
jgi:hypothetical protein